MPACRFSAAMPQAIRILRIYSGSLMDEVQLNLMAIRGTRGLSPLSVLNPSEKRYRMRIESTDLAALHLGNVEHHLIDGLHHHRAGLPWLIND